MIEKLNEEVEILINEKNRSFDDSINFSFFVKNNYIKNDRGLFGAYTGNYLKKKLEIEYKEKDRTHIITNNIEKKTILNYKDEVVELNPCKHKINAFNYEIIQFLDLFNYLDYEETRINQSKLEKYIEEKEFSTIMRNRYFDICSKEALTNLINLYIYYKFKEFIDKKRFLALFVRNLFKILVFFYFFVDLFFDILTKVDIANDN